MTADPVVRSLSEFLAHPFPPVEHVVKPWLPKRGIAMVSAWRGTGKTYFGLSLAHAIAGGGKFLEFEVVHPRKVLYVDGEMDPAELQQRLAAIRAAAIKDGTGDPLLADTNLLICSHAEQELSIPDLADPIDHSGQKMIEKALGDADVLILDNLSSLCRSGDENDAESWAAMQQWLVGLRRKDKTTLMIHHTGKPKGKTGRADQRGTSKREDVLNTSIRLIPKAGERGLFTFSVTKSRGFKAPYDFDVLIEHDEQAGVCRLIREPQELEEVVAAMKAEGKAQNVIAKELGGTGGGMMAQQRPGAPSAWLPYVNVDNLRAATDKAKALGATVVHDATEVPNAGSFSIIIDPTGAALGLWQPKQRWVAANPGEPRHRVG